MFLEIVEADPSSHTLGLIDRPWRGSWIVPADWAMNSYGEFRISRYRARWWALIKLFSMKPHRHYWPIRIVTGRGRVLFQSRAWCGSIAAQCRDKQNKCEKNREHIQPA